MVHFVGSGSVAADLITVRGAKLLGEATYGYDARLDGMLFGAVAHPPTWGATLETATEGRARSLPGVAEVVIDVADGVSIAAIITHASSEALGLAVGARATAIFKASSVIVGAPA